MDGNIPLDSGVGDRPADDERIAQRGLDVAVARVGLDAKRVERLREETTRRGGEDDT